MSNWTLKQHYFPPCLLLSVVESVVSNQFVSKDLKRRLTAAGKRGARSPGSCDVFKCHHHLLPRQLG